MKAVLKSAIIDFREVKFDVGIQEEIIQWGKGDITKGPDGGVFVEGINGRVYAATGKFIADNGNDEFVVISDKEFNSQYTPVNEIN